MINNLVRKSIEVDKKNITPLWEIKQEDECIIKLSLYRQSKAFDITGQALRLGIKRKDKTLVEVSDSDSFIINGNELDIKLKNSISAIAGPLECDLELSDSTGKMTTASFFINVKDKVLNGQAIEGTNEFDTFSKTVAKVEEDYKGLRRIIIDENQAANLQDQVNKTNAQLETNTNKTSFYSLDDDAVLTATIKSTTTTPSATNIDIKGKLITGTNRRWIGYDLKNITGVYSILGDGTKISNIYVTDSEATLDHRYPINFLNAKSIFCGSIANAFRWGKIEDTYITNMDSGISLKNVSYVTIDNNTISNSINGILVGNIEYPNAWNGGLNINNNHIRNNFIGFNGIGKLGTTYLNNNIFELNRTHIKLDGALDVAINNCYLMDGSETSLDVSNVKKLYINNAQISGGSASFYAEENGTTVIDKTLPFYNDQYTVSTKIKNSNVILKNVSLIGMNMTNTGSQFYSLFFDIDSTSTLSLDNVTDNFYLADELPSAGYANLCFFPKCNYSFIKKENSKRNYIVNGLFKNTDFNNTNNRSDITLAPYVNPWGGNVARIPNGRTYFYYKVPKNMIGKEMALTFYCGEFSNINTRIISGDVEIVTSKSQSTISPGRATKNGEVFALRKSVFIVKPTKECGNIQLYFNSTSTPSYLDFACVFLGDYDTYNKIFSIEDIQDYINIGTTSQRPLGYYGQTYHDTTINKTITYDGTNWVDTLGTTV